MRGLRGSWGILEAFRGYAYAGYVQEPLVLLVCLVKHVCEARNVVPVVPLPLFIESRLLPFPFLHEAELFTEDVYEGVCRRLETFRDICL